MEHIEVLVGPQEAGQRLDRFVCGCARLSRALAQQLIEDGHVRVDGTPRPKSYSLAEGQAVCVRVPPPRPIDLTPQEIPLAVVYEDGDLLVVDKPKGMVVHPAAGNPDGTLANALLFHCGGSLSGIGGAVRPGIVHRIDKDTSGLLVAAKNDKAHTGLAAQFAEHTISREYQAVVYGHLQGGQGRVEAPIARSRTDRKKMAVAQTGGKPAVTLWRVVAEYPAFTHLALRLQTGRTHQIRVHMAHLGHPVAGDALYGPRKVMAALHGQCLHAGKLGFTHPATGRRLLFESPLPPYFTDFLTRVGAGIPAAPAEEGEGPGA